MMIRTPSDLSLLIRARRKKLGLDQQALAKKVGVSRLWIIEFEKGKPRAEIGLVMRTLLALDLELDVSASPEATPVKRRPGAVSLPDIDAIVEKARCGDDCQALRAARGSCRWTAVELEPRARTLLRSTSVRERPLITFMSTLSTAATSFTSRLAAAHHAKPRALARPGRALRSFAARLCSKSAYDAAMVSRSSQRWPVVLATAIMLAACEHRAPVPQKAPSAEAGAPDIPASVLRAVCQHEPCGGDRSTVNVYRDGKGGVAKLYRLYGSCFHSPGLYFEPNGTLVDTIPEKPIELGSPEAVALQQRHDKQVTEGHAVRKTTP